MINLDSDSRLNISQILEHPWMKAETATQKEVIEKFKTLNHMQNILESEKSAKEPIPEIKDLCTKEKTENVTEYTGYFKMKNADALMGYLEEYSRKQNLKFKTCPNYYRMIVETAKQSRCVLQMNILKKHESSER